MKMYHVISLLTGCIICCLSLTSAAQSGSSSHQNTRAGRRINSAYTKSLQSFKNVNKSFEMLRGSESYTKLKDVADSISEMTRNINGWNYDSDNFNNMVFLDCKEELTTEFENYNDLFEAAGSLKNIDSAVRILSFIKKDMLNKGLDKWPASPVMQKSIKVRVLDTAGHELPNFRVFIRPEFNLSKRTVRESSHPTNSAVVLVVPGVKVIWAEKGNKKTAMRTEVINRYPEVPNEREYDLIYSDK